MSNNNNTAYSQIDIDVLSAGSIIDVVASDLDRQTLQIQNNSEDTIYVNFKAAAGVTKPEFDIKLDAGSFYEPFVVPTNPVSIYSGNATTTGVIASVLTNIPATRSDS